jgi:spoIIIJ-associated protein
MKRVEIEAKTDQEALKEASKLLNIAEDYIDLAIVKEKKGLLGIGGSTVYLATPNVNLVTAGKEYLEKILFNLGIECKTEFRTLDGGMQILYNLETTENSLLIGRDGKNLQALQFVLRNYLSQFTDSKIIVHLDIGGYHRNRVKQLEILATKTAKEVAKTKIEVKLDPMNSYERRVIHTKLAEWKDVETISEGEGPERSLIIKPTKK